MAVIRSLKAYVYWWSQGTSVTLTSGIAVIGCYTSVGTAHRGVETLPKLGTDVPFSYRQTFIAQPISNCAMSVARLRHQ
mgnify:CR=1 FL=1